MDAKTQIFAAAVLGTAAFNAGKARIPGADAELMAILAGRKNFETPKGEASSAVIMKAWLASWDAANITATA